MIALLLVFLLYSFEPIAAKYTSQQECSTLAFWLGLGGVFGILGLYAIFWQLLLKQIPLSIAYIFRGCTLIFVLILSVILLGDTVTLYNGIGALMIVTGIMLYSRKE